MNEPDALISVTDHTLADVTEAEWGVLVLGKSDCGHCAQYLDEVQRLIEKGRLKGVVVGKLTLDWPGCINFKRSNPWLASLEFLPYTLIYRKGEKIDEFAASKGLYLAERVEGLPQG